MTDAELEADAFVRAWAIANVVNVIGIVGITEEPIR